MSAFSERLNSTGLSARQAADKATELGVDLPYGTIAAYWAGDHPSRPKEQTLRNIAEVTEIPLQELRQLLHVPRGEVEPWQPPAEADRLSRRQRKALNQLIKSMVEPDLLDDAETRAAADAVTTSGVAELEVNRSVHNRKKA